MDAPKGFSLKIFRDRYAFTETETWQDACLRVAHQVATVAALEEVQSTKK